MSQAAAEHAVLKAKCMVVLQTLQAIPAAAANNTLTLQAVHWLASQAEVDITCATLNISEGPQPDLTSKPQLQPATLELIVHKLQVCAHSDHSTRWHGIREQMHRLDLALHLPWSLRSHAS